MLIDPLARENRLRQIGTSWEVLETALRRSEAGWRSATPNHSRTAPGQRAYDERLAALREEQKIRFGWENACLLQIELTVDPERTVAIQTLLGDHNTGDPLAACPRNKNPRGFNGRVLLTGEHETEQLSLFPDDVLPIPVRDVAELEGYEGLSTWVFLVHRTEDREDGRTLWHSELSRPHPPNDQGLITGWFERITLPTVEIGAVAHPGVEEEPEQIRIPVNDR
ncbi:hypothetical protein [Nocardiopsis aegyptia]|uniref:Uncharacterized protein n=1 Tax=Nocardiopsis aegyptia TaxID=220378 RepID=A0A7Z0ETU4_9ACTN|nr:hypothetical protein [Nocardiopsis aegyptia]NYJ37812.1 hypothetical protein [Nocardiopsis aegyptia]